MKTFVYFVLVTTLITVLISLKTSYPGSDILLLAKNLSVLKLKEGDNNNYTDKEKEIVRKLHNDLEKIYCRLDVPGWQQGRFSNLDRVVFYDDLKDRKIGRDKTIKNALNNTIIILPEGGELTHVDDSIIISLGKLIIRSSPRRNLVISASDTYIGGNDNVVMSQRKIFTYHSFSGKYHSNASLIIEYLAHNPLVYSTPFLKLPNDANITTKQFLSNQQISPIFKHQESKKIFSSGIFSDYICKTKKYFEKRHIDTSCKSVDDSYQLIASDNPSSCELDYEDAKKEMLKTLHITPSKPIKFDTLKQGYQGPLFFNNGNRIDKYFLNKILTNYNSILRKVVSSDFNNTREDFQLLDNYREILKLLLARMKVLDLDYLGRNFYDILVYDHKVDVLLPHLNKISVTYNNNGDWAKYVNKASDFSTLNSIPIKWQKGIAIKPLTDYPKNVIGRLEQEQDRVRQLLLSSSEIFNSSQCGEESTIEFGPYKEVINNSFVVGMTRIAHVNRCNQVVSFKLTFEYELFYDNPMTRWKATLFDPNQENINIQLLKLDFF